MLISPISTAIHFADLRGWIFQLDSHKYTFWWSWLNQYLVRLEENEKVHWGTLMIHGTSLLKDFFSTVNDVFRNSRRHSIGSNQSNAQQYVDRHNQRLDLQVEIQDERYTLNSGVFAAQAHVRLRLADMGKKRFRQTSYSYWATIVSPWRSPSLPPLSRKWNSLQLCWWSETMG